jgi:hypothetical protein
MYQAVENRIYDGGSDFQQLKIASTMGEMFENTLFSF